MGLQIGRTLLAAGHFLAAHWVAFAIGALILVVCAAIELYWVNTHRLPDSAGNGIAIGAAKAFDNRSLALRVERLNAGLENLKLVNQSLAERAPTFQQQTSSAASRTLSVGGHKGASAKSDKEADAKKTDGDGEKTASGAPDTPKVEQPTTTVGLAAGDVLSDQLNLASQIFNLQLLYERSLSDRMIDDQSRVQTVLGFQVSITPPSGYENCAAVAEIAVRMLPPANSAPVPVSLVALMPQEKTYNAESISSSERSIGGSAVARVLTLDFTDKRGTRQLFIHRDSDTVAFERDWRVGRELLEKATVFGWEFRPVLGRSTVSAGTRQMLAVIAVPVADAAQAGESILEIRTRSYWRRYDRKRLTSTPNWSWLPWRVDRSSVAESEKQELAIPNTARIQATLSPTVTDIKWVSSGRGKATVIVKGTNFFSGTKVVMGGAVHQEENGTLTLKSDQALEFETTIDSLATGDAVLSCRYGPSYQLSVPPQMLKVASLYIARASIKPLKRTRAFRLSIDLVGQGPDGSPTDVRVQDLESLPEPILFVGNEAVAMPYDYADVVADPTRQPPAPVGVAAPPGRPPIQNYVTVQAWISAKTLTKSPSVSFRVPFCGFSYQASQPLSFSEPTAVRMGTSGSNTIFRIFYPQGFGSTGQSTALSIDLDQTYVEAAPTLIRTSDTEYRLTVSTATVARYQNMVLRLGTTEPYLVPIPLEDKLPLKPQIDPSVKPPQIVKGKHGPVEWVGSGLDAITEVTIAQPSTTAGAPPASVPQAFSVYASGTRLLVHVATGIDAPGKVTLECTTAADDKLTLTLFVVEA